MERTDSVHGDDRGTRAEAARDRILRAAAVVLAQRGSDGLTIAAVAHEAGMSKGGLFYHFPSKESLVQGLIWRYVEAFDTLVLNAGDQPGSATSAYLRSAERGDGPASQIVIALLAAAMVNPEAMEVLRRSYQRWNERLAHDGVPSHIAATIRFAVDGLWLADSLALAPVADQERKQIINYLAAMLNQAINREE